MGKATDMTGSSSDAQYEKGPVVWAPRAQCDKKAYQFRLKWICEREPKLDIKQGQVAQLLHKDSTVLGVETTLEVQYLEQRLSLPPAHSCATNAYRFQSTSWRPGRRSRRHGLSGSLKEMGIELGRLKTGTPPACLNEASTSPKPTSSPATIRRHTLLIGKTICSTWNNQARHQISAGSILSQINGQLPCYVTYTTDATAQIIRANLHKSRCIRSHRRRRPPILPVHRR